jgi:hypothetical protein
MQFERICCHADQNADDAGPHLQARLRSVSGISGDGASSVGLRTAQATSARRSEWQLAGAAAHADTGVRRPCPSHRPLVSSSGTFRQLKDHVAVAVGYVDGGKGG